MKICCFNGTPVWGADLHRKPGQSIPGNIFIGHILEEGDLFQMFLSHQSEMSTQGFTEKIV
jgi:hypothetical protein